MKMQNVAEEGRVILVRDNFSSSASTIALEGHRMV
jgi:hypothetical protein